MLSDLLSFRFCFIVVCCFFSFLSFFFFLLFLFVCFCCYFCLFVCFLFFCLFFVFLFLLCFVWLNPSVLPVYVVCLAERQQILSLTANPSAHKHIFLTYMSTYHCYIDVRNNREWHISTLLYFIPATFYGSVCTFIIQPSVLV